MKERRSSRSKEERARFAVRVLWGLWGAVAAVAICGAVAFVVAVPRALTATVPLGGAEQTFFAPSPLWHASALVSLSAEDGGGSSSEDAVAVAAVPPGAALSAVAVRTEWSGNATMKATTTMRGAAAAAAGKFWRRTVTLGTGSTAALRLVESTAPVDVAVARGSQAAVDAWIAEGAPLSSSLVVAQRQAQTSDCTFDVSNDAAMALHSETFHFVVLFRQQQQQQPVTISVAVSAQLRLLRIDWPLCQLPCEQALPFTSGPGPFFVVQGGARCSDSPCVVTLTAPPRRAAWWLVLFVPVAAATLLASGVVVLLRREIARRAMLRGSPLHRFSQLPTDDDDFDESTAQQLDPLDLDVPDQQPQQQGSTDAQQ